jgi:tetratricopeptide (TPR) repeat protein
MALWLKPLACVYCSAGLVLFGQYSGGASGGGGMPRMNSTRTASRPPTFITGQVFIEDGAAISSPITIVGGCRGSMQLLGYTDMQGHFSLDVKSGAALEDATSMNARGSAICELAARLDGYRSNTIDLSQHNSLENPDIGTILLHRIGDQEGSTVSMTSLQAPKSAHREFDKGQASLRKDRLDDAARHFAKAVAIYPRYADAWNRLGHVQVQKKEDAAARTSFARAIAIDPKLVPPYVELAAMHAGAGRWREVLENSRPAIRLDSFSVPAIYFFDALANYNLQNWDATEKSARRLEQLDTQHRFIKINRVLAVILAGRHDYAGAAEQMRDYLKFAGDVTDAPEVRAQLTELEKRLHTNSLTDRP